MKNTYYFGLGFITILLSAIIIIFSSKSARSENKALLISDKSVALFDYFSYKGNDSFYNENALQDSSFFFNPILPGWHSDPSICTNGEDYFLITSTFTYFPGIPLYHSKDLVNWSQAGYILDRESQMLNMDGQGINEGIFAPSISYNPFNETYYVATTNIGYGNFYVETKDPFGAWSDPILLPEVIGIDPSFFFDDDGKAYIVNSREPLSGPDYKGHQSIVIQEFDINTGQTTGQSKVIADKGVNPENNPIWLGGPHIFKVNNKYLLIAAEGGTEGWHSEVVFSCDAPMGNYKAWEGNPMLTQRYLNPERPNPVTCAGHADLVQTPEGDWWAFFLARRPIDNFFENLGREAFMMPVKWSEDGFPYITKGEDQVQLICKKEGAKRDEQVTFGNFEVTDNFMNYQLNDQWQTLRSSASDYYSLSDYPGYLTLKCTPVCVSSKKTPAYIGRRLQHHSFECSTRMIFDSSQKNERAGMLLYKDENHYYFFWMGMADGKRVVGISKTGDQSNQLLAKKELSNKTTNIELKVVSTGLYYNFYYSLKPDKWNLLCKNVDASHLSSMNTGGFTGTTIGVYATSNQ